MGVDPSTFSPQWKKLVADAESGKPSSRPVPAPAAAASTNLIYTATTEEQKLNKLERAWLAILRRNYEIVRIQALQLKLGDDCRYCPDFYIIDANGQLICHEVKGFMRDDALVKLKTAARIYREFRFMLVKREKGQWIEIQINP